MENSELQMKFKILIVDDSEINRMILSELLGGEYDISEAENGVEAIEILRARGDDIDLVMLDFVMPEMDGFGVLRLMNSYHLLDSIPVIMVSAENEPSVMEEAYEMGVTDYISRPFDAFIVRHRVENTLKLYGRQKKLVGMVAHQIFEREKGNSMMIDILSHIVEFRNGESGLHVLHIRTITELLLKRLVQKTDKYGLSKDDISTISLASSFHDIGKIAIPSEILNKPGRLTDEEFKIMKTHSAVGASILGDFSDYQDEPLVKSALEICRWHHERYDGRGYPDGLKGEEIPISAQIVSLADVYDALTSERCYKKAFSHEKAVEMILNGECGAFNPLLLECLIEESDRIQSALRMNISGRLNESRLEGLVDEILGSSILKISNSDLATFEEEREKNRYFASKTEEIQFDYDNITSTVSISEWGAKFLGKDRVIFDAYSSDLSFMGEENVYLLADKLHKSTPEKPEVELMLLLSVGGELRWHRIMAKAVWSKDEKPEYLGAVGIIVDIHDKRLLTAISENENVDVSAKEMAEEILQLRKVFDSVRLVDAEKCIEMAMGENGKPIETNHTCYSIWNRKQRCENCVSVRAFNQKNRQAKFELVDSEMYCIIAKYAEVGGRPCVLEAVAQIKEEDLNNNHLNNSLFDEVVKYKREAHMDVLTGVYNRRYFEENIKAMGPMDGVAMIDLDNFKKINDKYGHSAGDAVLHDFSKAVSSNIRSTDMLVRYGGDEFLLLFPEISADGFERKLAAICDIVEKIEISEYPEIKISISIGGAYAVYNLDEALWEADKLMYDAKRQGKKNVVTTIGKKK